MTTNQGPHGFSEILFAYSSAFANNGQNFAGLNANSVFYNLTTAIAMLAGRFGLSAVALATAGCFAEQGRKATTLGTLATDTPLFCALLIGAIFILTGLNYLPVLSVGPIVEQLMMNRP